MILVAAVVGMLLLGCAYALGVMDGRQQTVQACILACEHHANRRIDDLLARIAARSTQDRPDAEP